MEQHELSLFFIRSNARCAQHQFILWSWSYLPMKSNTASLNIRIYTFLQIPYSTTTTLTGARTWHYDHQRKQQHNKSSPLYTDVPVQTEQMHSITTISKGIMGSNQKWKSRLFRVVIARHRKNQENHEKYISSPPYTDVPVQTKQMHSITTISKVIMCSNQKLKSRLFRVVIGQNRLAAADILKFSCNITNIAFRVRSLSEGCCISVSSFQYQRCSILWYWSIKGKMLLIHEGQRWIGHHLQALDAFASLNSVTAYTYLQSITTVLTNTWYTK